MNLVLQVFLEGVKAALTADIKFQGGWYSPDDPPVTGLRAAARVYAGWGFTQAFYWHEVGCTPSLICTRGVLIKKIMLHNKVQAGIITCKECGITLKERNDDSLPCHKYLIK